MGVWVWVCVRERDRERHNMSVGAHVCIRENKGRKITTDLKCMRESVCVCVCVCACVYESE